MRAVQLPHMSCRRRSNFRSALSQNFDADVIQSGGDRGGGFAHGHPHGTDGGKLVENGFGDAFAQCFDQIERPAVTGLLRQFTQRIVTDRQPVVIRLPAGARSISQDRSM